MLLGIDSHLVAGGEDPAPEHEAHRLLKPLLQTVNKAQNNWKLGSGGRPSAQLGDGVIRAPPPLLKTASKFVFNKYTIITSIVQYFHMKM